MLGVLSKDSSRSRASTLNISTASWGELTHSRRASTRCDMTKRKADKTVDENEQVVIRERKAEIERRINEAIAAAHERMRKGLSYAEGIREAEEYGMELVLIGRELSARGISRGQSMMLDCSEKCMRILKAWHEWRIMQAKELARETEVIVVSVGGAAAAAGRVL